MAVHSATNATFDAITATGNTATYGGAMFVDRTALLQVLDLSKSLGEQFLSSMQVSQLLSLSYLPLHLINMHASMSTAHLCVLLLDCVTGRHCHIKLGCISPVDNEHEQQHQV